MSQIIKKNIIAFTIEVVIYGLIISLVMHQYFFQSFKVTTSSMEPTLIGDLRCGDRILVKKYAYNTTAPKRWDIPVFRYPQNNRKIFIKRLVGLPGERIHIRDGEIYINGSIARKPDDITDALLYPLYVQKNYTNITTDWEQTTGWKNEKTHVIAKTKGTCWTTFIHPITNRYVPENKKKFLHRQNYAYPVGGGEIMGEIRFQIEATPLASSGHVEFEIREGIYRFVCLISMSTNKGRIDTFKSEEIIPIKTVTFSNDWKIGATYIITFSNIDDIVRLEINGKTLCSFDYSVPEKNAPKFTLDSSFRWGITNSHFRFHGIKLWRDIYYIPKRDFFGGLKSFQIPKNHFFVLGDNPPNSRDSKDWKRFYFFFKNGIAVEGDQKKFPHGETRKFTDIYGYERNIPNTKLKEDYLSRRESPFVPKSYIIGRAFLVYWPPNRAKITK